MVIVSTNVKLDVFRVQIIELFIITATQKIHHELQKYNLKKH